MPERYYAYYEDLIARTREASRAASAAKSSLADSSPDAEPKIAIDLADRVAKMHDIDIAGPLRKKLGGGLAKEDCALEMAREIALGGYAQEGAGLEERLELAVRVGLAIVTEGVTVAPLQGISGVEIRENADGSRYLAVSIAGPMRSAGGTESAVTMLIADHVRRAAELSAYRAGSFGEDEAGRFVEELRIYEREASNFQFRVVDEDIRAVISNLPVEIDGPDTDPYEVVNHRNMRRIKTDRVRGGALRVINDGIIGRSKKLLKRVERYGMDGWDWLKDLEGAVQAADEEDAGSKRMREVIVGRSVLSMPGRPAGFRIRYGRACNTGFTSIGFHPAVAEMLDHAVAVGTQVKTDIPGKGATAAFVDSLDAPIVRLAGGDVVRIRDARHGAELRKRIEKVLHMGDALVSFGDFLENNARLVPTGYVEEYWEEELRARAEAAGREPPGLRGPPSLDEALRLSEDLGVPLHPRHLFFWDLLSPRELAALVPPARDGPGGLGFGPECKPVLEKLGVPHAAGPDGPEVSGDEARILRRLLCDRPPDPSSGGTVPEIVSRASGIELRPKFSASFGVKIGRPEKASPRAMKPPVHCLFPVGTSGGQTRDLVRASGDENFYTRIADRSCTRCSAVAIGLRCDECGAGSAARFRCVRCKADAAPGRCAACGGPVRGASHQPFPLKRRLQAAQGRLKIAARQPLKGVEGLVHQDAVAEPIEKGILRQHHGLTVFRDGTVRFDTTNAPLTHFRPSWIGTGVGRLRDLGYSKDVHGGDLEGPDQTVELMMQDVVLPADAGRHLVAAARYVDDELEKLYGAGRFYNVSGPEDLLGHLVVGLAPHTSVGVVCRVIGFTNTHVCFGTPNWHSAKRRDADGDADSVMLLMDAMLNFSKNFLSDKIGGLMDAPLLIQPVVMPFETQPQAHNLEAVRRFPLRFFEATLGRPKAADVDCVEVIKSRLGGPGQFSDYHFTHPTSTPLSSRPRSAYSEGSMLDKLDMQMRNASIIDAVDEAEVASSLISTHLVPDMMGNLRSYARQQVRCTRCKKSYRRPPLSRRCACGNGLIATITQAGVEKYLLAATRLVDRYDVGAYQRCRIHALRDEMALVFGGPGGGQALLTDFGG